MPTKNKHDWFRPKGYTHILPKISESFAASFVTNSQSVESYAFLPLIHVILKTRKFKKVDDHCLNKKRAHSYLTDKGKYKRNAKPRKIFYANHLDAQIYSYYANEILGKEYEKVMVSESQLSDCVTAYRKIPTKEDPEKNKCNIHFAKDVFDYINEQGNCVAIAFDISKFFDSLNHEILYKAWCELLQVSRLPKDHYNVYKSLTNFSYVNLKDILQVCGIKHPNDVYRKGLSTFFNSRKEFIKNIKHNNLIKQHPFYNESTGEKEGIPQGTPISAFLANLYLLDFDKALQNRAYKVKGLYRRYSDDIVFICAECDYEEIRQFVIEYINDRFKLVIQTTKTQVSIFRKENEKIKVFQVMDDKSIKENIPFQYLGLEFNGELALLKSSSVGKYYRQAKRFINKKVRLAHKEQKFKFIRPDRHKRVFKRQLYKMFTHLGRHGTKRNYVLYANDAAKIFNHPKNPINKQINSAWNRLNKYLQKKIVAKGLLPFNKRLGK